MDDTSGPEFLALQQALIGRYSLQRELGRGGMGVVYLARDVQLDRPVALKVLPAALATQPALRERFLREARTSAKLSHPNIVPIFSVDETTDFVYFAMAFVDGETLAQRVASRGPLVPADAARMLREVAWALAYAHAQGVVHRDVKPANILLETGSGRALVADFGIARLVHPERDPGSHPGQIAGSQHAHTTGEQRLGTPEFMSPEQASGDALDGRSDLYSLGVVAFYALSGRLPFEAPTVQALLAQHITRPAPPISSVASGVPRTLAIAVDRCLQKDPAARFESGEALANALASSLERSPDVPVPIRVFLDRRRFIVPFVPALILLPQFVYDLIQYFYLGNQAGSPFYKIAAEMGVATAFGALPVADILSRLRNLMKLGYGPDDVVQALRNRFERRREEFHFDHGFTPSVRERATQALALASIAAMVVGAAGVFTGAFPLKIGPLAVFAGYIALGSSSISGQWRRLRRGTGSAWEKFWRGSTGQALGRIAALGLGPRAIAADRPTELAIAMSAESLFASLPKELRSSLGDFPAALRRLEDNARKMRERVTALDASLAEAQRVPSSGAAANRRDELMNDLRARRDEAHARLQDVITALETLRLQLLRIGAGADSLDSLTADLNAARDLGDQTERLLAGRADVERALIRGTPPA
jgi:serine/threonine-protein kinase